MEKYVEAREKALKNLRVADHMLTVTYPLVKDPKLLLSVIDNIFLALTNSMAAILYYERMYKRVPVFEDTFESKFDVFKRKAIRRLEIDTSYLQFMLDMRNIITQHKDSPVEFSRKGRFFICSDDYRFRELSIKSLKDYVQRTRVFVYRMNELVKAT